MDKLDQLKIIVISDSEGQSHPIPWARTNLLVQLFCVIKRRSIGLIGEANEKCRFSQAVVGCPPRSLLVRCWSARSLLTSEEPGEESSRLWLQLLSCLELRSLSAQCSDSKWRFKRLRGNIVLHCIVGKSRWCLLWMFLEDNVMSIQACEQLFILRTADSDMRKKSNLTITSLSHLQLSDSSHFIFFFSGCEKWECQT